MTFPHPETSCIRVLDGSNRHSVLQTGFFSIAIALHEVTALYKTDSGIVAWTTISNYHDFTKNRQMLPLCLLTPLPRKAIREAAEFQSIRNKC